MSTKSSNQPIATDDNHTPLAVIFAEAPDWRIWREIKYLPIEIVAAYLCELNETERGRLRWSSLDQQGYDEVTVRLGSAIASKDIDTENVARNGDNITRLYLRSVRAWVREEKLRGLPPQVGTNIPETAGSGRRKKYPDQEAAIPEYLANILAELSKHEIEELGIGRIRHKLEDKLKDNDLEAPGERWFRKRIGSWANENDFNLKGGHSNL